MHSSDMTMSLVSARSDEYPFHGPVIRWRSKGKWNHSLVAFEYRDCNGDIVKEYFESCWKKDKVTGKTGVRHCEWANLIEWEARKKSNQFIEQPLPYSTEAVEAAYAFCVQSVGTLKYAKLQIWWNTMGWQPDAGGQNEVTCSEFSARAIEVAAFVDTHTYILCRGYQTFNAITPSGPKSGLSERVAAICQVHSPSDG